ncbi:MAG TPA: alpha/beta hydrolase [Deltaproteobacteria bacterium]|nr:alpha/beta hydrolase [Deltaproteobacteria bacterium]
MGRLRFVISAVLTFCAATYLGYGLLLWVMQERMLFPAPGGIDVDALDQAAREIGAVPISLVASDGVRLYGWHQRRGSDRLLIYFPGNAETVAENVALHRLLLGAGWDVFALAYRGYPGSEGSPTEAGVVLDALAAWAWARGAGYAADRIVLHGRSLGGGIAAHLAEARNPAGLVLESTFVSARALARARAPIYPVDQLIRNPFDTIDRAPRVGVPVFLMHSRDDEVIPLHLGGVGLQPYFAEAEYHETSGLGHGHCLPVMDRVLREAYLAYLDATVPRRRRAGSR